MVDLLPIDSPRGARIVAAVKAAQREIDKRSKKIADPMDRANFIMNSLGLLLSSHARALKQVDAEMHRRFCVAIIEHLALDYGELEVMAGAPGTVN